MPIVERTSALHTMQSAVTGASPGLTVANAGAETVIVEVSGTYTNLEATFEISIDEGVTFWPVTLELLSTAGTVAPKLTAPGLYKMMSGVRAMTHFRAPIATTGTPTGAMTIKVMGIIG